MPVNSMVITLRRASRHLASEIQGARLRPSNLFQGLAA